LVLFCVNSYAARGIMSNAGRFGQPDNLIVRSGSPATVVKWRDDVISVSIYSSDATVPVL